MRYTHKQQVMLLRIHHVVEDIMEGKRKELAPLEVSEIRECYHNILKYDTTETILANVVDVFANCGFTVKQKGIGWSITI